MPEMTYRMKKTWNNMRSIKVWAMIAPNGEIIAGSDFRDEEHTWQIGLGWPSAEEIAEAKKKGYVVKQLTLIDANP